jgi:hypothetical protein
VCLEASDTEVPRVEAVQKPVSYVLAKIDLTFGNSVAATRAKMVCPSFGLLQDL